MSLVLDEVSLFLNGKVLVGPFSLRITGGEIVTLMGPSGCGKSSLLAGIAGNLELPLKVKAHVALNGRMMETLRPEQRRIGRLFQDDYLFPHLTTGENLLFGMPRGAKHERTALMQSALRSIGLDGFENRAPHSLSGGQRSRVALMRALLAKPDAVLLDEPFNKLDQSLRADIRALTFAHIRERKIPALLVTHDRADAPLGSRIMVITPEGEVCDV